jgi:uncharacterized protein (TIGR00645 family)
VRNIRGLRPRPQPSVQEGDEAKPQNRKVCADADPRPFLPCREKTGAGSTHPLTPRTPQTEPLVKPRIERILETGLFASRWLMAPIYVGLALALAGLVVVFGRELLHEAPHLFSMDPEDAILVILSLIDLSLAGNLLLIVIFSGYENFVSRIDKTELEDRPEWMGTVDFSALKMKLLASIIAISAVALLKQFMIMGEPGALSKEHLIFLVVIHLTFVVSGLLMAAMDWLSSRSGGHG